MSTVHCCSGALFDWETDPKRPALCERITILFAWYEVMHLSNFRTTAESKTNTSFPRIRSPMLSRPATLKTMMCSLPRPTGAAKKS